MRYSFETEYEIGEVVFYATPDGDSGIITEITFNIKSNIVSYKASFGRRNEDEVWCYAEELSNTKVF